MEILSFESKTVTGFGPLKYKGYMLAYSRDRSMVRAWNIWTGAKFGDFYSMASAKRAINVTTKI